MTGCLEEEQRKEERTNPNERRTPINRGRQADVIFFL